MEKIPSIMVLHKHVEESDTRFATMAVPLANNPLGKWLVVIRIGTYRSAFEDIRWGYEPVSDLWPNIEIDIDSSDYGYSDEGRKDQDNPDGHEQEEVALVTRRNPRSLIRGDQRALSQLGSELERSKDKIFFTKHRYAVLTQTKWYLVQVDMDQSYPVTMRDYGVYLCRWYIRHHEDCTKRPIMECRFWTEIRKMH